MACTVKGVDVLVPDDLNFEQSKYLMLQSGTIVLRSHSSPAHHRSHHHHGGHGNSGYDLYHNDPLFVKVLAQATENGVDEQTRRLLTEDHEGWEEYKFKAFDLQVLYIPSVKELENTEYGEGVSKDDIERGYALLRRTEIKASFAKKVVDVVKSDVDVVDVKADEEEKKSETESLGDKEQHSEVINTTKGITGSAASKEEPRQPEINKETIVKVGL